MELLLAFLLTAVPQEDDPTLTAMPEGWVSGKKSGWDGDYPPEWEKKTDEEKQKFLELWNRAKSRYIRSVLGAKGLPTGPVTAITYMLKAVNAGLTCNASADIAIFGQGKKLKEADFKIMLKAASSAYGTEVPHNEVVVIVKDLVTAGLLGGTLDQRVRAEIMKRHRQIVEDKAKKEKEPKEGDGKDPKK